MLNVEEPPSQRLSVSIMLFNNKVMLQSQNQIVVKKGVPIRFMLVTCDLKGQTKHLFYSLGCTTSDQKTIKNVKRPNHHVQRQAPVG